MQGGACTAGDVVSVVWRPRSRAAVIVHSAIAIVVAGPVGFRRVSVITRTISHGEDASEWQYQEAHEK
jgi:hypothetical protein